MSDTLVVVSLVLQALIVVVLSFSLFYLFRSQGRLLLRIENLERGGTGPAGFEVGTAVDDFQLPDLLGQPVSLSQYRDKKVLLVYWSPDCGFCEMMAEELAPLQKELKARDTELVILASGGRARNKKLADQYGLAAPILLFEGTPAERYITDGVFQNCGTPSAYMLDGERKIKHRLVVGSDEIVRLARETIGVKSGALKTLPLSESRIERSGIKPGVPAPSFQLPDINGASDSKGETVALEQFRGRKVLLVFSDPHCGPCDALAPDLVKLHRKHRDNGMAVVLVGRGDPEENRKKAMQFKMEFPVVLQDKWKLSREYGIFATPVAFLISKDGVIMKNVATGTDEIMRLASEGLTLA